MKGLSNSVMAGVVVVLVAACGGSPDPAPLPGNQGLPDMAGSQVRIHGADPAEGMLPVPSGASVGSKADIPANFTPDEDILFTDPDDPEASVQELSAVIGDPSSRRGPWEKSIKIAKQRAMREGKPLLIWFTDSNRSPMCKAINEELFTKGDFVRWAQEHLIRLKVDEGEEIDDSNMTLSEKETMRSELRHYVKRLKNQYRVLGYPSLVMLSPSGKLMGNHRGYRRGEAEYKWGLLRQGVVASEQSYKNWRASLEAKGYREWHDNRGRSVFAKLTSYRDGVLTLIEPDGTRSRTHEKKLSGEDREWIAEQKRRRAR